MVSVKNMLEFLTGRPTPVKDMFRIGRFKKPEPGEPAPSRPRPIVLKLASPWDHRLVLASRFNLKHFGVKGILFVKICPLRHANSIKSIFLLVAAPLVLNCHCPSLLMWVIGPFRMTLLCDDLS